ncbi:diiron oxygenase [Aestuariibacter sp. AA17]|uniref:Diiron oxygenase n=1 Tax=Fluctibacter corallii TaxID=2984329 RepID=A0ABT3A7D9_9ALTE|nr:diiron oxygenase [Aestuariibacter sp. AA17]MCV2884601.1 diiron oxygenase [Aestuariibacter sp. AA17]
MNSQHHHHEDHNQVLEVLSNLEKLWNTRAMVHNGDVNQKIAFDASKPDFKENLLPFCNHDSWKQADPALKAAVLSYGWIIYNQKTINIESKLITPVCDLLIEGAYPGSQSPIIQNVISQALVDEAFHTLLSVQGINIVYRERQIQRVSMPQFELINQLHRLLDNCQTSDEQKLIRLAVATASETLITDYLSDLANDREIQPLCYESVAAHAADEWSHASVFSYTMAEIYHSLSEKHQRFYLNALPAAIASFGDSEWDVWAQVLEQIGFPNYKQMLLESKEETDSGIEVDLKGVSKLLGSLGIDESEVNQIAA